MDSYDNFDFKIITPPTLFSIQDDIEEQMLSPLSCLREFESYWLLEFDLPLVNKDNINITIDENLLTVQANLNEVYSEEGHGYHAEFKYFKKKHYIAFKNRFRQNNSQILKPKIINKITKDYFRH